MEIIISKMVLADLEKIQQDLEKDFDDFWSYNILKQEIVNGNSYYAVAKNTQGEILGFAGVQFILDEANITNIVTKKIERNKGIGYKLLNELIDISKQRNMASITLEVNENNVYALKLYNRFNFELVGKRINYYNGKDTALIMTKKI